MYNQTKSRDNNMCKVSILFVWNIKEYSINPMLATPFLLGDQIS